MSGSSGDETYLESFVESISTLPHELRRDLELLKDLDCSYILSLEQLRKTENGYVTKLEEKMMNEVVNKLIENEKRRGRKRKLAEAEAEEEEEEDEKKMKEKEETKEEDEKSNDNDKKAQKEQSSDMPSITLPTTEEIQDFIYTSPSTSTTSTPHHHPHHHRPQNDSQSQTTTTTTTMEEEYNTMQNLKTKCYKLANEKIQVAEQAYSIVDSVVGRLENDLKKFETLLKGTGEFEATGGAAKPNDLAAIQVNPNSTDWILAKVISHDPQTAMYKLSDEDVESNKIFNLPESQVVVLGGVDRLSRGDIIYAVYPDTTSFYQATVAQAPRKVSGGGSFVMVNFKDDGDENGVTHDKAVLMKHVMRVPYVMT